MNLLLETISMSAEYDYSRNGFYQGSGLDHFLNAKLAAWIQPRALNLVVGEVHKRWTS